MGRPRLGERKASCAHTVRLTPAETAFLELVQVGRGCASVSELVKALLSEEGASRYADHDAYLAFLGRRRPTWRRVARGHGAAHSVLDFDNPAVSGAAVCGVFLTSDFAEAPLERHDCDYCAHMRDPAVEGRLCWGSNLAGYMPKRRGLFPEVCCLRCHRRFPCGPKGRSCIVAPHTTEGLILWAGDERTVDQAMKRGARNFGRRVRPPITAACSCGRSRPCAPGQCPLSAGPEARDG